MTGAGELHVSCKAIIMTTEDPQKTWSDYYKRKKLQRMEEASILWEQMCNSGINEETVLALDFLHFGSSHENITALANQLSENYEMEIAPSDQEGYWFAKGTTRPHGITLTKEQHSGWVEFMADVAQSYGCVFSTWSLEEPSLGIKFNSENINNDS